MSVSSTNNVFILTKPQYLTSAEHLLRHELRKCLLQTPLKICHVCISFLMSVAPLMLESSLCFTSCILFRPSDRLQCFSCYSPDHCMLHQRVAFFSLDKHKPIINQGNCRLHFAHAVHSCDVLPTDGRCGLMSTCRRRTKPQTSMATCAKNLVKITHVVPEISSRTDRRTDRHTHHNTSQLLPRTK